MSPFSFQLKPYSPTLLQLLFRFVNLPTLDHMSADSGVSGRRNTIYPLMSGAFCFAEMPVLGLLFKIYLKRRVREREMERGRQRERDLLVYAKSDHNG